ncbi:MAG: DegQ family serine endoprotease [Alphaproteobacteria bacterium]|nr:DegQ family serine endoprotease [Alphaproteobacteria bacterium]
MKSRISRFAKFTIILTCFGFLTHINPAISDIPITTVAPAQDFANMAEKVIPTVVNISTTMKIESPSIGGFHTLPDLPSGSPFEELFKHFYEQYQNGNPPTNKKVSSLGSGFVIDATNGYIVTNSHVIRDADEIKVILNDNTTLDAVLVGTDEKTDIALLKVKSDKPLVAAKWGDSDTARIGSWVLAIGNPFGLGGTVTAGIVSARHRDINAGPYDEYIQTDASINRGNSGGPMFNINGEVIGVNTAIFSPSGGSVGIGFAVPSNFAKGIIAQLIKYGKTKRGWLGVRIQKVTPEIAESLGLDKAKGAMVSGVTEKGPAEKSGIKSGDIILKFDGHSIDKMRQLPRMVADTEVGKKVFLTLWRKGRKKTVTVNLGQLEKAEETGMIAEKNKNGKTSSKVVAVESIGLGLSPLTKQLRSLYKISKETSGVIISEVKRDSVAADKGLEIGDVIVEVDQHSVSTPKEASDKISAAQKAGRSSVLFFIARGEDMRFVALKLKK